MPTGSDDADGDRDEGSSSDDVVDAADLGPAVDDLRPSPEELGPSPEELGPSPDDLGPSSGDAGDGTSPADELDPGDAPAETVRTFWRLVAMSNVATVATALGPMLVYFRGRRTLGGLSLLLGIGVFAYMAVEYRRFRRDRDASNGTTDAAGP